MAPTSFEELEVYRLSERLADAIWATISGWDRFARDTLGKQMVRAADSIGANIAEGTGRGSFQDNRRFVRTARGWLNETKHWLRRAHSRKLLSPQTVKQVKPILDELAPRLNAYLRSIGSVRDSERLEDRRQVTTDNGPGTTDD
jgi:four helix bundle protein